MLRRIVFVVSVVMALAACDSTSATTTTETAAEPTVTVTGGGCNYEGPETFTLGSEPTFMFVNDSSITNVDLGVWTVPDGTTLAGLSRDYATSMFEVGGDRKAVTLTPTAVDSETPLPVVLDTPGTWATVCRVKGDGVEWRVTFAVADA